MALSDYRLCDVCGSKAFYDAQLNYAMDKIDRNGDPKLERVGDIKVICDSCVNTHEIVIDRKQ